MRIVTFRLRDDPSGLPHPGLVLGDQIVDLTIVLARAKSSLRNGEVPQNTLSLLEHFSEFREHLAGLLDERNSDELSNACIPLSAAKLTAPILRPGKIICLAGNYREHIKESGFAVPGEKDVITQQLFLKPATAIIGNEDEIVIGKNNLKVGWETELAVVIGKKGRSISSDNAWEHVFGYTILNDVSERALNSTIGNRRQREMDRFLDWLAGKWFDTFAPCGPWIVTADEVSNPHNLDIRLTVNGQVRQQGNTGDMIFAIPEQLAYASSIMTLEPGDIISTGTPVGAGVGGADSSLNDGDVLICEIEKIGSLKNTVRCSR